MIRDFQAAFRVSNIRKALILFWYFVLAVAAWVGFDGMMLAVMWVGVGANAMWAWREPMLVVHLSIDRDYQAWLLLHDDEEVLHEASLLTGSLIHRWGCFLRWECGGKVFWQMILPDMLDAETFRRLRVWAVFGQKL